MSSGSGLEINKIAAAVLLAGIIAMVAGIGAQALYHGGLDHGGAGHEEKRGYTIAGAEAEGAGEGAAASAEPAAPVDILPFLANADVEAGKAQSKKCTACHTFEKGGKNGVGPNQWNLIGSAFAHKDDFNYSPALKAMHDKKWDFQALSDFLANPKAAVPGNKMAFAGMKKPEDRANLIAYLATLSDNPVALPK